MTTATLHSMKSETLVSDSFFSLASVASADGTRLLHTAAGGTIRPSARDAMPISPELSVVVEVDDAASAVTLEGFDGKPLLQKLQRGPLEQEDAITILRGVATALDELHRRGFVHGTLRTNSALVDDSLKVLVVDWPVTYGNLSRAQCGELLGYAAPEILLGEVAGPAADQFALGALAHLLLLGKAPFADASAVTGILRMMTGIWRNDYESEVAGQEAFGRVFAADPANRFSGCAQFVEALSRQLAEARRPAEQPQPIYVSVPAPVVELPPPTWPLYAMWSAGALLVVALLFGIFSWLTDREIARLATDEVQHASSFGTAPRENGRMRVCNSAGQPVIIHRLAVGYFNPQGSLVTFESSRVQPSGWVVQAASEQNVSWTGGGSNRSPGANAWNGEVLFYFLDIETQSQQYILAGTWKASEHGCLSLASN